MEECYGARLNASHVVQEPLARSIGSMSSSALCLFKSTCQRPYLQSSGSERLAEDGICLYAPRKGRERISHTELYLAQVNIPCKVRLLTSLKGARERHIKESG